MAEELGGGSAMREYRKGNWTVSETMVLIEAKQMDDGRRMKRSESSTGDQSSSARAAGMNKPAELRWKWIEDYCWKKGCLRSQNQCNDKWDNLMRDYKKVRDYERSNKSPGAEQKVSYWKMEKNERKDKNLPSNMLLQIYEALVEVVEKRGSGRRIIAPIAAAGGFVLERVPMICCSVVPPSSLLPPNVAQQIPSAIPVLPLPPPPPSTQPQQVLQAAGLTSMCGSSDSDTSEYSADKSSPAKRRRRQTQGGNIASMDQHRQQQQGTGAGSGGATEAAASGSNSQELLGTAISRSASVIAEALHACEERQERRHRDLVGLHERRLEIEESKSETNRLGINGLVDAINKLANSIFALASSSSSSSSSPNSKNQQPAPN